MPLNSSKTRRQLSPESLEAFASGNKQRSRVRVLEYLRSCRERGATVDEVSAALGVPPNGVSGRFTELHRSGTILKVIDPDGKPLRRTTRAGCGAGVYVCGEFANPTPSPEPQTSLFDIGVRDRSYSE